MTTISPVTDLSAYNNQQGVQTEREQHIYNLGKKTRQPEIDALKLKAEADADAEQLASNERLIDSLSKTIEIKDKGLAEQKAKIVRLEVQVSIYGTLIASMSKVIEEKDAKIVELEDKIEVSVVVKSSQGEIDELKTRIESYATLCASDRQLIDSMMKTIDGKDKEIDAIKAKVADFERCCEAGYNKLDWLDANGR